MEDYILREINRIGELIAALLDKIGLLKKSGAPELIRETAKTELAEQLNLDIDTLLAGADFIATLVDEYGFSDADLEKFAELLFDFTAASEERGERLRLAAAIGTLYSYLDEKKATASLDRYYILKDLEQIRRRNLNDGYRKTSYIAAETLTGNSNRAKSTRAIMPASSSPAR